MTDLELALTFFFTVCVSSTGCVDGKDVGDSPLDTESDTGGDASSDASASATSTTTGDTTGSPGSCPANPSFSCSGPVDCDVFNCGGPLSEFDADGCLRPRCGDGVCPEGSSCVTLGDWGSCAASTTFCEELDGTCQCGGTLDCNGQVSICVEDSVAPPAACNNFTDEQSCLDAGCSLFVPIARPEYDVASDSVSCPCESSEGACLWWPDGVPASDDQAKVYVDGDTGAALFFETFDVPPVGWSECTSSESPLPECRCGFDEPICV